MGKLFVRQKNVDKEVDNMEIWIVTIDMLKHSTEHKRNAPDHWKDVIQQSKKKKQTCE